MFDKSNTNIQKQHKVLSSKYKKHIDYFSIYGDCFIREGFGTLFVFFGESSSLSPSISSVYSFSEAFFSTTSFSAAFFSTTSFSNFSAAATITSRSSAKYIKIKSQLSYNKNYDKIHYLAVRAQGHSQPPSWPPYQYHLLPSARVHSHLLL